MRLIFGTATMLACVSLASAASAATAKWFEAKAGKGHVALYFDNTACSTDEVGNLRTRIVGGMTLSTSFRPGRVMKLKVPNVCFMGYGPDNGPLYVPVPGGHISAAEKSNRWNFMPDRRLDFLGKSGTFPETFTFTGYTGGTGFARKLDVRRFLVVHHVVLPEQVWQGTDGFVNYCINHLRPIRSENGRLYCWTESRYWVAISRL